jgi:hypothetical protein
MSIEQVKYENHLGEILEFGSNGLFINESDLHDYKWDYSTINDKIDFFSRGVTTKSLPIRQVSSDNATGVIARNNLAEIAEKDVLAHLPGKLWVSGYYLTCCIIESKKSSYLTSKSLGSFDLTAVTDNPYWIKEATTSFKGAVDDEEPGEIVTTKRNFDFNFDYPFDFQFSGARSVLVTDSFVGSNFRMTLYGHADNPTINVGSNSYGINGSIALGEYLVIDSTKKTITLYKNNGEPVNWFDNRNRDNYIFELMPPGTNNVTWNGISAFDITLLDERSEPKWE